MNRIKLMLKANNGKYSGVLLMTECDNRNILIFFLQTTQIVLSYLIICLFHHSVYVSYMMKMHITFSYSHKTFKLKSRLCS